jgi:hypothetical protein
MTQKIKIFGLVFYQIVPGIFPPKGNYQKKVHDNRKGTGYQPAPRPEKPGGRNHRKSGKYRCAMNREANNIKDCQDSDNPYGIFIRYLCDPVRSE